MAATFACYGGKQHFIRNQAPTGMLSNTNICIIFCLFLAIFSTFALLPGRRFKDAFSCSAFLSGTLLAWQAHDFGA